MAMYKFVWNLKEDIDEGINNPRIDIFESTDVPSLFKELVEDGFLDQLPEKVKEENSWDVYDTKNMEIFIRKMEKHVVGDRTSHWW